MTPPSLINFHPDEYSQEILCYAFAVNLDGCVESCDTLNDLYNNVFVPNKTKDLGLHDFNMIARIN